MKDYIKALLISILAIFAPIKAAIITVLILVIADAVTGVWAAIKRGDKITSARLGRTASKLFIYETAMIMAFLTEQNLTGTIIPFMKIISGFISVVEMKSLLENLNEISGTNLLKSLVDRLSSPNNKDIQ